LAFDYEFTASENRLGAPKGLAAEPGMRCRPNSPNFLTWLWEIHPTTDFRSTIMPTT